MTPAPVPSQPESRQEPTPEPEAEIIPYRWNAKNIRIAVAGAQRRSGVTVTAFNLAAWLAARGAEVAYIEVNTNRHLQLLLNVYEAAPTGEHYTIDGIDCYLTNEPDREYQFIIYDCGVIQTPTSSVCRESSGNIAGSCLAARWKWRRHPITYLQNGPTGGCISVWWNRISWENGGCN